MRPAFRLGAAKGESSEEAARRADVVNAGGGSWGATSGTLGPVVSALAVTVALLGFAGPAQQPPFEFFRMPSGNIGCVFVARGAALRCDVLSGLRPEPRGRCELDWTGLTVAATGRARPVCAGDTAVDRRAPVLRYGRTWRRGGITCLSRRTGLRCRNRDGHGFFLSRARWIVL